MEISVAQKISLQINSPFVTPALVQAFLVLSRPVRNSIQTFIDSVEISLNTQRSALLQKFDVADKFSRSNQVIFSAVNEVLQPVDNLMKAIPLDSIVAESPEVSEILKTIQDSVPLKIPATTATVVMGVGGFDFFDGVSSYRDLRSKLDDLESRIVRATSMRNYASKGLSYVNNQLDKIRAYRQVITLLND
jgi:hypothetical protein